MQQRQPRLGDILDDYCTRERRVTNHAVVAMVGHEVKQTRCTTCEAEHEYKHAKVPRQRRKSDTSAALLAPAAAGGPKRVPHEPEAPADTLVADPPSTPESPSLSALAATAATAATPTGLPSAPDSEDTTGVDDGDDPARDADAEGPVHRPLIRATLPRTEGQPPPQRQAPDFTIRQPGGRQNRFRPRQQRGGPQFFGGRPDGNMGGGMHRQPGGRPPHHHQGHGQGPSASRRQGPKRPK